MVIKVSVPGQFQFKLLPTMRNLMFSGQSEVHYIGGSDILPSPLNMEDEAWYLERLIDGDQEARAILIEHNLRLVVYI